MVKDRLAVIADKVNSTRRDAKLLACGEGGLGVDVAETRVKLAEFAGDYGSLCGDAEDLFADGCLERDCGVVKKFDLEIGRRTGNAYEGNVDAVNGSAGHHAED